MKSIGITLCALMIGTTVACNQTTSTTNSTDSAARQTPATGASGTSEALAAARTNYQRNCLGCHGDAGQGGRVEIEGKTLEVPSYKGEHAMEHSDQDFVEQIQEGGDGMPPFKDKLRPEEIADLVRFIRTEFQGR